MLEARIRQGQLLKRVIDSIKEMVNDINFECCESGIGVQAVDPSHVALIAVSLVHGAFEHYICTKEYCLGLNMVQVSKIMRLCGPDYVVTLKHDPTTDSDHINFIFEAPSEKKISDFSLRLMSFDTDNFGIPERKYDVEVTMPSKTFIKIVSDLSQFGETITIEVNSKRIKFKAQGDFGTGNTLLKANTDDGNNGENVSILCEGDVMSVFSSRYLLYFTKGCSLSESITLSLTNNMPLQLKLSINDDPFVGSLIYYLAPKLVDAE